jgi:hypothetical protein
MASPELTFESRNFGIETSKLQFSFLTLEGPSGASRSLMTLNIKIELPLALACG